MKFTSKETKESIYNWYKNILKITNKEFFELKRKLFKDGANKDKYTMEDVQKLSFAKILLDIGFLPQKAVDKLNEKWNDKNSLIDEMIKVAKQKKKHLDDIIVLLTNAKIYEDVGVSLPLINTEGMSEYAKRISKEINKIIKNIEIRIDEDNVFNRLIKLIKKGIELKNKKIDFNTIKADAYAIEVETVLGELFGNDIKKLKLSYYYILNNSQIKNDFNNFAKQYDTIQEDNFDYAHYIGMLILMKYYKELFEKLYYSISSVIDCDPNDITADNVKRHIVKDVELIKTAKQRIKDIICEYYLIVNIKEDVEILLNDIYNFSQTFFNIANEGIEEERKIVEEIKTYSKLILVAKTIWNEYDSKQKP